MKKSKKDDESYYAISGLVAIALTILIHYFLLADLKIPSTIHVTIGIFIVFFLSAAISSILSKFWDKF